MLNLIFKTVNKEAAQSGEPAQVTHRTLDLDSSEAQEILKPLGELVGVEVRYTKRDDDPTARELEIEQLRWMLQFHLCIPNQQIENCRPTLHCCGQQTVFHSHPRRHVCEKCLNEYPVRMPEPTKIFSDKPRKTTPLEDLLASERATAVADMAKQKDGAYLERNQVVAALAKCAIALGWKAGRARTAIEGWSDDWHGVVYIDLPTGQVSWHYHDSHAHLFENLPEYWNNWDGHDTTEKYRRVAALSAGINAASDAQNLRTAIRRSGFAVMETSGDWDIYDVSEKGKAAEAKSLEVANQNVDLSIENQEYRIVLQLLIDSISDDIKSTQFFDQRVIDRAKAALKQISPPASTATVASPAEILALINSLRVNEADAVTIPCDNPNGESPNNVIQCNGEWTNWIDRTFSGESLVECLRAAVAAKATFKREPLLEPPPTSIPVPASDRS